MAEFWWGAWFAWAITLCGYYMHNGTLQGYHEGLHACAAAPTIKEGK